MPNEALAALADPDAPADNVGREYPTSLTDEELKATSSEDDFIKHIKSEARRAVRHVAAWNIEAKEDYEFALGRQWTPEEKALLAEQFRPALTINKIGAQVKVISGYQRNNASRIKANPEGGEDVIFSETVDRALLFLNKVGKLDYKLNQMFDDGLISGKGCLELVLSYQSDPLHGDLLFRSHGPFVVFKDPDSTEYDSSDAEFMVKIKPFTRGKLKAMFPKETKAIDELTSGEGDLDTFHEDLRPIHETDADNYGVNPRGGSSSHDVYEQDETTEEHRERKFLLIEYWYKKYVERYFWYDPKNGRLERFDTEEEANARQQAVIAGLSAPDAEGNPVPVDPEIVDIIQQSSPIARQVSEMWVCAIVGDTKLVQGRSPLEPRYHGFPFIFYYGDHQPSAERETERIRGLVRDLKDPQREVNKSRSQYLHIVNTSANSGWIADTDAMSENQFRALEQFGSKPGHIAKKTPGAELTRVSPTPPPIAQNLREQLATQDLKEVSGVNADLLGVQDKDVSGRALSIRIQQALTIVAVYFENWKQTKQILGEAIFRLLPEIFDAKKLANVVGQQFMQERELSVGSLGLILANIADGRYDVAVTDATDTATARQETFQALIDLAQAGVPIPPDVIVELSNIQGGAQIIERMKAFAQEQQQAAEQK